MIGRSCPLPPPEPPRKAASATEPVPEPQLFRQGIPVRLRHFAFGGQPKKPAAREVPPFDARWAWTPCNARRRSGAPWVGPGPASRTHQMACGHGTSPTTKPLLRGWRERQVGRRSKWSRRKSSRREFMSTRPILQLAASCSDLEGRVCSSPSPETRAD